MVSERTILLGIQLQERDNRKEWIALRDRLKSEAEKENGDFKVRNDYAVALVHLGDVASALAIFEEIERSHPGHSETAANLGTSLELSGRDADALKWIREGIARNVKEHQGSEWLHVRILEAKLAMAKESDWLKTHSVAGADFGGNEKPALPSTFPNGNEGKPVTAIEFRSALQYQLGERLEFVKPPDAIVADLLFDWGNIEALTDIVETAEKLYAAAEKFGSPRPQLLARRHALVRRIIAEGQKNPARH